MRVSGVRSESVIGCQRQKLRQTASNFPDVKMATGDVKFLRGEGSSRGTSVHSQGSG